VKGEDGRFLTAVLGGAAGEYASHLADQRAFGPETSCRIEKLAHLTAHIAEPGGGAEDDGISGCQFLDLAHGDMGQGSLGFQCSHLFQNLIGKGFPNPA